MNRPDVLCFGETMALFVANQTGELAEVGEFHKRIAGADSNVAIGLSRLGLNVAWLSRVGQDSFGRFVVRSLERDGVNCQHVAVDPAHPTGFQLKSRQDDGQDPSTEYFRRGSAASFLSVADLTPALLSARHLHATGIPPALSASALALSEHLMGQLREAGASVSFDPNLRPALWPSEQVMVRTLNSLAAKANSVLPGLAEGRLLTGYHAPADIAAFYLGQGAEAVVIKLGAEGAYWRTGTAEGHAPGFRVAQVVDTVGAGDGFAVGVVSALLEGLPLPEAVRRGNWIGSLAVQSIGDSEGLPQRAGLEGATEA